MSKYSTVQKPASDEAPTTKPQTAAASAKQHGSDHRNAFASEAPTFKDLCALDPRILTLHRAILAIQDDGRAPSFCANALWYGWGNRDEQPFSFKEDLCEIVGFPMPGEVRAHPFLATSEAYEMVTANLYAALPPCRNCRCIALERFMEMAAPKTEKGGAPCQ